MTKLFSRFSFLPIAILTTLVFDVSALHADITLKSPAQGEVISMESPLLRALRDMEATERWEYYADPEHRKNLIEAREALSHGFQWITDNQEGDNTILISESEDFSVPSPVLVLSQTHEGNLYTAHIANFLLGKDYFWKVEHRAPDGTVSSSPIGHFKTDPQGLRLLTLPTGTHNLRDLGGYPGLDGRMIRQGMIYRSAGLNDSSPDYQAIKKALKENPHPDLSVYKAGATRLTPKDIAYIKDVLKWKTDLDLRTPKEVGGMQGSPAGESVAWVNRSSATYDAIFGEEHSYKGFGPDAMVENFRLFADRKNYPIVFHCTAGKDRTGSLAYVLNGLLGMDAEDLTTDWMIHSLEAPNQPGFRKMLNGIEACGTPQDPLSKKIENYLLKIGVKPEEIASFRAIMLEN